MDGALTDSTALVFHVYELENSPEVTTLYWALYYQSYLIVFHSKYIENI